MELNDPPEYYLFYKSDCSSVKWTPFPDVSIFPMEDERVWDLVRGEDTLTIHCNGVQVMYPVITSYSYRMLSHIIPPSQLLHVDFTESYTGCLEEWKQSYTYIYFNSYYSTMSLMYSFSHAGTTPLHVYRVTVHATPWPHGA